MWDILELYYCNHRPSLASMSVRTIARPADRTRLLHWRSLRDLLALLWLRHGQKRPHNRDLMLQRVRFYRF